MDKKINSYHSDHKMMLVENDHLDKMKFNIRDILQNEPESTIQLIMDIRKEMQDTLKNLNNDATHEDINDIHNYSFDKIKNLISPEVFEKIFDHPADQKINIVDKDIFNKSKQ